MDFYQGETVAPLFIGLFPRHGDELKTATSQTWRPNPKTNRQTNKTNKGGGLSIISALEPKSSAEKLNQNRLGLRPKIDGPRVSNWGSAFQRVEATFKINNCVMSTE